VGLTGTKATTIQTNRILARASGPDLLSLEVLACEIWGPLTIYSMNGQMDLLPDRTARALFYAALFHGVFKTQSRDPFA
jgi:hypothetical protein